MGPAVCAAGIRQWGFFIKSSKQVVDLNISHTSTTESLIHAKVQGTTLYTVSMRIQDRKHTTHLQGECSCPLKQNCKHIVATLLQAVDHQALFVAETKNNVIPFDSKGKPDICIAFMAPKGKHFF